MGCPWPCRSSPATATRRRCSGSPPSSRPRGHGSIGGRRSRGDRRIPEMTRAAHRSLTLVLLLAALVLPVAGHAQKALRPYTLILDFVPTGEYVPHYTALEKGWYHDEGLDVKIVRGQGSADTVKRVAAGQGEVGISDVPALIAARATTDAVPFFVVHEARIRKIARQQNADIRVLTAWADLGLDLSSTSLVAREETIAKDPDGLKAFLRATLKGADYAFRQKHLDEGIGYLLKHHPEVDPDGALGAAQVATRFVYAEEVTSGKVAVGQFEPVRLEKTRDTYTQYLELKRKVPLEEIYTNDLLPEKK